MENAKAARESDTARRQEAVTILELAGERLTHAMTAAQSRGQRSSFRLAVSTQDEVDEAITEARKSLNCLRVRFGPSDPATEAYEAAVVGIGRLRVVIGAALEDRELERLAFDVVVDTRTAFFERASALVSGHEAAPFEDPADNEFREALDLARGRAKAELEARALQGDYADDAFAAYEAASETEL